HTRTDSSLRQVHRRNVTMLEVDKCGRQLSLERGKEVAARSGGCICGAWAADKDDAGGKGVGPNANTSACSLSADRPSAADRKTSSDYRVEEGLPASTGC